jgi:hypothetical protein
MMEGKGCQAEEMAGAIFHRSYFSPQLWLANCYFSHFSAGSQLNVTMLRWAENG